MIIHNFNHRVLLRSRRIYHFHDLFVFCKFFYIYKYHKHKGHTHLRANHHCNDTHDDKYYTYTLANSLHEGHVFLRESGCFSHTVLTSSYKTKCGSCFSGVNKFLIQLIKLLIIFLFLYFVKEIVSVLCFPLSSIFYIPIRSLYLPIRYLIFYCKRWYIPY